MEPLQLVLLVRQLTYLEQETTWSGAVTLTGAAVTLQDTTATAIAGITSTGDLSVTSGGAITQTGAIDADLASSFTAGANAITLTNASNDFSGAVSLSNSGTNDVALTDANALDLGTVTVGQNLTVTTGGALTDSGAITVGSLATIVSTGQAVTLGDSTTANFGSIDFAGSAVSIKEGSSMEVTASEATGVLSLEAAGAITQTGAIDADLASSFTAGVNAITLTNTSNDFSGAVSLSNSGTNDVALADVNALDLGTVTVGQNLTVTTGGSLTDSGAITVGSLATIVSTGQAVTLGDSTTANFGSFDFAGSAVSIIEGSSMEVAASEATGVLSLEAAEPLRRPERLMQI